MDKIQLKDAANPIYVGFSPIQQRVAKGCKITICKRCGKLTGHWPKDSIGSDVICLNCAYAIQPIREHVDRLAKERGE
jgi:hypothetical protein